MNGSPITRLAAVVAALGAGAVLAAPPALADPPNYQRNQPRTQSGLRHVPEIVSGIAPSAAGRPAPQPEVIGGIAPAGGQVLVSSLARPAQPAHGFDWADAGIGAGVALAGAALASACAVALRKRVLLAH